MKQKLIFILPDIIKNGIEFKRQGRINSLETREAGMDGQMRDENNHQGKFLN